MHRNSVPRRSLVLGIIVCAAAVGLGGPSTASAAPAAAHDPVWVATSSPTGRWATDVAVSRDGERTFVAGQHELFAYDAHTGDQLWSVAFNGDAYAVAVGPDGRGVYVTVWGQASSGDFGDYDTMAYDQITGKLIWRAVYDAGTRDYPCCLKVSPDGRKVFVTGWSQLNPTSFDFATVAYNARSGGVIWVSRYNGGGMSYDVPTDMGVSPDGHLVYVTGESPVNVYNDFATIAYDAISGQQVWLARYNSGGTRGDTPYALAVDPTGQRVIVTGCSGDIDYCVNGHVTTVAYAAGTGAQEWVTVEDAGTGNIGVDASISRDGSTVYVIGDLSQGSDDYDIGAFAYDAATGTVIWANTYSDLGTEYASDAALDPDGSQVVVTGATTPIGTYDSDIATVSFDTATGAIRWATRWNGPGGVFDEGNAIALNPAGTFAYVAGRTVAEGCCGYEFVTLAYLI